MRKKTRHLSEAQKDENRLRWVMLGLYGLPGLGFALAGYWGLAGILALLAASVMLFGAGPRTPRPGCRSDLHIAQQTLPLIE